MKFTWLGQSGLLFETDKVKIMIDPYLSNSLGSLDKRYKRRVKINKKIAKCVPDILILTTTAPDALDSDSVTKLLEHAKKKPVTVLASRSAYNAISDLSIEAAHDYMVLNRYSEWTAKDIRIKAVPADSSDPDALGLLIEADGKRYYYAGYTLYNETYLASLPKNISTAFLPVNGVGGVMNLADAKRAGEYLEADCVVPIHYGMFDRMEGRDMPFECFFIAAPFRAYDAGKMSEKVAATAVVAEEEPLVEKSKKERKREEKETAAAMKAAEKQEKAEKKAAAAQAKRQKKAAEKAAAEAAAIEVAEAAAAEAAKAEAEAEPEEQGYRPTDDAVFSYDFIPIAEPEPKAKEKKKKKERPTEYTDEDVNDSRVKIQDREIRNEKDRIKREKEAFKAERRRGAIDG